MNCIKYPLFLVLFLYALTLKAQPFEELSGTSLPNVDFSATAWGDYDNDGYLDFVITGNTGSSYISRIYRNNGDNTFTHQTQISLAGVYSSSVAWGDYNNDGYIDLLLCGEDNSGAIITNLYKNNGNGSFTLQANTGIPNVASGSIAWGDYNNDGYLDVLYSGYNGSSRIYGIYKNKGDGTFSRVTLVYGAASSCAIWGDYNNDGLLDFSLSGLSTTNIIFSSLYKNNGDDTFTKTLSFTGSTDGSNAWGDYNNDGFLDLIITGYSGSERFSKIYKNNGNGTFAEQTSILLRGVYQSSVVWGDYDNDGYLDILLTGDTGTENVSLVYKNNGNGTFSEQTGIVLPGISGGSVAWGDFDNDNDLDILMSSISGSKIYKNNNVNPNSKPNIITGLNTSINENLVTFCWDDATDPNQTAGLNYNLFVFNTQNDNLITSPHAFDPTNAKNGKRLVAEIGTIQDTSKKLTLPIGEYKWSVQAIDASLEGGEFATEENLIVPGMEIFPTAKQTLQVNQYGTTLNTREVPVATSREWKFSESIDGPFNSFTTPQTSTTYQPRFSAPGTYYVRCESIINSVVYESVVVEFEVLYFVEIDITNIEGVERGDMEWGDYDRDGFLDLLVTGYTGTEWSTMLYRNNGNSSFTAQTSIYMYGAYEGDVSWFDYNSDGFLDILLIGTRTFLYENNGNGNFTEYEVESLPEVIKGCTKICDFDGDGISDIFITGFNSTNNENDLISKLYQNKGNGTFIENTELAIPGLIYSSLDWGDYNNDGFVDFIICGGTENTPFSGSPISRIYKNNGDGTFSYQNEIPIVGVLNGDVSWGDYNNDGLLDIAITGSSESNSITKVYKNNGNNTFSDVTNDSLLGVYDSSISWGDFNNDGFLDLLVSGWYNGLKSVLYKNDGSGNFIEQSKINLFGVYMGENSWVDYNNDGKLDIFMIGRNFNFNAAKLYRNDTPNFNSQPEKLTNLISTVNESDVSFSWSQANDNNQSGGHNYNLYVYDVLNETYQVSPNSFRQIENYNGKRLIVEKGNIQNTTFDLNNLPVGSYKWSVQAIDASLMGGNFSEEKEFMVNGVIVSPSTKQILHAYENGSILHATEILNGTQREWKYSTNIEGPFESFSSPETGIEYIPVFHYSGTYYVRCESMIDSKIYYSDPVEIEILQFKEQTDLLLSGVAIGNISSADFNNDTFLDIILTGYNTDDEPVTKLLYNNGDGTYAEQTSCDFAQLKGSNLACGDFNNDGYVDIFMIGNQQIEWSFNPTFKIYKNNGNGSFSETDGNIPISITEGSIALGDIDNDGLLDLILTGLQWDEELNHIFSTQIYRNNGDETFSLVNETNFTPIFSGCVDLGDFNNDGFLDLAIVGLNENYEPISQLYKNNGDNSFTEQSEISIKGVDGSAEWGDYNNDGFLDLLISGNTIPSTVPGDPVTQIYKNNGDGSFTLQNDISLTGVFDGEANWGDYNNDGFLDIFLVGISDYWEEVSKVYKNNGNGGFIETDIISLGEMQGTKLSLTDSDNDGDLDIMYLGYEDMLNPLKFFRNDNPQSNLPSPLSNLQEVVEGNNITFSWDIPSGQNQINCYSYNLYLYDNYDNSYKTSVYSFPFDSTQNGKRLISQKGKIQGVRNNNSISYTLNGVIDACKSYSWSVQAIDATYSGGPFAQEVTFSTDNSIPDLVSPIPDTDSLEVVFGECSAIISDYPSATDNCAGEILGTTTDPLEYNEQGTYTITWIFDDGNGNVSSQIQTVIIDDEILPIPDIDILPDLVGDCSLLISEIPIATDNCTGEVAGTTNDPLEYSEQGTYTITWNYDDGNGNVATQNQTVIVSDEEHPSISCIIDSTINLSSGENSYVINGSLFDPEVYDNCSIESILNNFNNNATLDGAVIPIGTTTVTWTAVDVAGNTSTCTTDLTVNEYTSIVDLLNSGISVYPNPTKNAININFGDNKVRRISLFDISGKQVFEKSEVQNNETISLVNQANGIYLLKIETADKCLNMKVVKE
ncbi:MAG TPA: FG-GAP-like repeat-containing protein [Tenuifilaceae bacterium]|nr:FG-GAP-like repeat-containing protein [Tenuifilaceae bacterium]